MFRVIGRAGPEQRLESLGGADPEKLLSREAFCPSCRRQNMLVECVSCCGGAWQANVNGAWKAADG